jgi:hypothetical protein
MAETIVWKEPGPSARGTSLSQVGVWMDRLSPLVAHPGRWALVHTAELQEGAKGSLSSKGSGIAAQLRSGKARIPEGKWEFTSRQGEVYARYVGPE